MLHCIILHCTTLHYKFTTQCSTPNRAQQDEFSDSLQEIARYYTILHYATLCCTVLLYTTQYGMYNTAQLNYLDDPLQEITLHYTALH